MEILMVSYNDMNSRLIIVVALPERSLLNRQLVIALPLNRFSCHLNSDKNTSGYFQCFWSRNNVFHRCGSLGVIGNGQKPLGPLCATWRITLPLPTTIHLVPHTQTHASGTESSQKDAHWKQKEQKLALGANI